jgi:glutathione synthase/RimK-type ligase-like ATP-grasp enzyme
MPKRVLILSAGTGASNSLVRSLRAGDPSLVIVGCNDDHFFLKKASTDRCYLIPRPGHPGWAQALRHIVATAKIDLTIPISDADVRAVSSARTKAQMPVLLPRHAVIELCQDKYRLTTFLRARGFPVPASYLVTNLKRIHGIFRRLAPRSRAWCRIRKGTGSAGAIPVKNPGQARSWITYWNEMRGIPVRSFILSEYLPGRDFGCQSLWKEGKLVLIKTYERLSYLGAGSHPSQISSVAALAKTVNAPRVVEICARAIPALDKKASGVFSVDLKESARGVPCVTEINAGRFSFATNLFDLTGKHNMAVTYVRLALGEPVSVNEEYDVAEDYYMLRDADSSPRVFHADECFEGIQDARR